MNTRRRHSLGETIALNKAVRPATMPISGITTILPGTRIYERSKRQGLLDDDSWLTEAPPLLHTGEYDTDELIALRLQLTRGVCPELFEQLRELGFGEGFFRLRRLQGGKGRLNGASR